MFWESRELFVARVRWARRRVRGYRMREVVEGWDVDYSGFDGGFGFFFGLS